jgi:hypothetical protein
MSTVFPNTDTLINPADSTASPFYTANRYNTFVGNAAIGGWTGFATICSPNAVNKQAGDVIPSSRPVLEFDGNSAHSTGFYWTHAGAVYMGGFLNVDNLGVVISYNPGRYLACMFSSSTVSTLTNTKAFLASTGILSWGNALDVNGLEVSDFAADGMQVMGVGVYFSNILMNGRTKNKVTTYGGCTSKNFWNCPYRNWYYFEQPYVGLRW